MSTPTHHVSRTLLALAATFVLASCGTPNTPEAVGKAFMEALKNMDYKAAAALATEDTGHMLEVYGEFVEGMTEEQKAAVDGAKTLDVTIIGTARVDGDSATITFRIGEQAEDTLELIRVEGKWKAIIAIK